MSDFNQIQAVIGRTRRRLRLQAALDWATTAVVPATALALVTLWLWRMEWIQGRTAGLLGAGLAAAVLLAGVASALRRIPAGIVAARVDRASGLASRLATAWDFAHRLGIGAGANASPAASPNASQAAAPAAAPDASLHPDTLALMQAAVADGARAASRANVKAAAPYRAPRDSRPALAFLVVGAALASLAFGPRREPLLAAAGAADDPRADRRAAPPDEVALVDEDLEFAREMVKELEQVARDTGDPHLAQFAKELEALLTRAEQGGLSKQELLAEMDRLENAHMGGDEEQVDDALKDLRQSGKDLKKEPLTRELGEALEQGDMEKARQELEKIAEKIEKKELEPAQEQKLAEALDRAAKQREAREKKDQSAEDKKLEERRERVRRLQRKAEAQPQDEDLKRRLQRERRELERLEREQKEQRETAQKRRLQRLHRNLQDSAENLRDRRPQAAQNMRDAAQDAGEFEDEIRKIDNRKRAQSQLSDLKDALRRARPGNRQGQGGQGRAQRIQDYQRRAGGGQGNSRLWRPGQGGQQRGQGESAGRLAQGQQGQGQGQQGQGQGQQGQGKDQGQGGDQGPGIGDQPGGELMGDPTARLGTAQTERATGRHGRGPSRRQTILTAAKRGFASTSYRNYYVEYRKILEEVMAQEDVPQGYRYYVKRYFQRIKPRSAQD